MKLIGEDFFNINETEFDDHILAFFPAMEQLQTLMDMEFITREDFLTHMYDDVIDAISDEDDAKLTEAIDSGIGEAMGYLARFDLDTILTSTDRKTYAILRTWIKDITKWHFIAVCNVATDLELAETRYKEAIKRLIEIQRGVVTPKGWALKSDQNDDTGGFTISSRPKRGNYY